MLVSRKTKRVVLGFGAIGLVVLFILVASARFLTSERERQRYEQQRAEIKPPPPVSIAIEEKPLTRTRRFSAELLPWTEADVPAEVAGRVTETLVEAGQAVQAGDVLVQLDPTQARIAVDLATARHTEAVRLLGEAERLQKSRVVSQTAFEAANAEARATQAQLEDAIEQLADHTIRAPFAGIVNERLVDVGDAVTAFETVARVVDLERLRVRFHVTERDLAAFQSGETLSVRLLSGRHELLNPVIRFVSRSSDPKTRLFRVEAELDNRTLRLPGGLQAVVEGDIQVYPPGPVVPAAAVRFAGSDATVLKDDGSPEPVPTKIVIGPEVGGVFPVLDGLQVGDKVFIR